MNDRSSLKSQIGRDIFRLFGTYVLGVTALIMLLAVYGIYFYQKEESKHYKALVSTRLLHEVGTALRQATDLAESPAVWTALTDSAGRGTYLLPLLNKANANPMAQFELLDYRGRSTLYSANASGLLMDEISSVQKTAQDAQMHWQIARIESSQELLASVPISANFSEGLAGILVMHLDLTKVIKSMDLPKDLSLRFGTTTHEALAEDHDGPSQVFSLSWAMAGRELTLQVEQQQSYGHAVLFVITGLGLSMCCGAMLFVGLRRWARDFSTRTTQRLQGLVQLADNTLQGRHETAPPDATGDEISAVSLALQEMVKQQRLITQQLTVFSKVFETAAEGILITDPNGLVVDVNAALLQMTGYTKAQLVHEPAGRLYLKDAQGSSMPEIAETVRQRGMWRGETCFLNHQQVLIPVLLSVSTLQDTQGHRQGHVSVFSDIRPMRQAEQKLKDMLHEDPLSGMPNYRAFLAFMQHRLQGGPFALLFIDMDHFKQINDTFGHEQGDAVIRQIAHHLRAQLPAGHFLCRRSGDEFMAVVDVDAPLNEFKKTLQRLFKPTAFSVSELGAVQVTATFSAGAALYPDHAQNLHELLIYADTALLQAKESGRNQIQWLNAAMLAATSRKSQVDAKLALAIQTGKIQPWYQPEVDLESGRIIGFEALARWQDEELGMVSPTEFIHLAEQSGAIDPLTQSMFAQVVRDSHSIRDRFPGTVIALNSSPQLLSGKRLLAMLTDLALQLDNSLEGLVLEITETDFAMNPQELTIQLQAIIGMGMRVAIDDFGKSYSSLSRLASLPIQKLKMDMSFVAGLEGEDNRKIVSAILALAQSLRLEVTAEGVETPFQRDTLLQLGCRQGQGFGFAKPMPLTEILTLPPVLSGSWGLEVAAPSAQQGDV